jgi:murein endopeptidase
LTHLKEVLEDDDKALSLLKSVKEAAVTKGWENSRVLMLLFLKNDCFRIFLNVNLQKQLMTIFQKEMTVIQKTIHPSNFLFIIS